MAHALTIKWYLTVALVTLGASFQFYTFGVVNPPQLIVGGWINESYVARNGQGLSDDGLTLLWSLVVSSAAAGAFVGCLLTQPLAESLGRRNALVVNGAANVGGAALQLAARWLRSPELLIGGRLVLGANLGIGSGLVPLYLTEITPVRYRGAAGTAHMIATALGDWLSLIIGQPSLLGGEDRWQLAFAFPGLTALALVLFLPFCPETPRFLLLSRRREKPCREAVRFFCGAVNVDSAVAELQREALHEQHRSANTQPKLIDFVRERHLRVPMLISLLVATTSQFAGGPAIFPYSTAIFSQAGLSIETARLATAGCGAVYFLFVLPSPYLIERVGRRPLYIFQLAGCLGALVLLAVFEALRNAWPGAAAGAVAALLVYMCVYGLGSPVPWMITSELFDQRHRSTAISISTFALWLYVFVISVGYLPLQSLVGPALSFLPFILVLSFGIVGIALTLPETKNRNIEDIVDQFRRRRPADENMHVDGERRRLLDPAKGGDASTGYGAA